MASSASAVSELECNFLNTVLAIEFIFFFVFVTVKENVSWNNSVLTGIGSIEIVSSGNRNVVEGKSTPLLRNHNSAANKSAFLYMKEIVHVLKDNRLLKLVGRLDAM